MSTDFYEYLRQRGITHELTIAHTPEQNGVAERMNRTLIECARTMLSHAGLPKSFWGEAVNTAAYIRNRTSSTAFNDCTTTPYERWHGKKPDVSNLRVFGCVAYGGIPKSNRLKLDKKCRKLRFVGYSIQSKGYRLYDETSGKVSDYRDVTFNETNFTFDVDSPTITDTDTELVEITNSDESQSSTTPELRRSSRPHVPVVRYGIDEYADVTIQHTAYQVSQVVEPLTYDQAKQSPQSKEWLAAADSEYQSLIENRTWDLVELPPNRKPIGSKWVFKAKHHSDGTIERFKGRVVAKGYSQQHGVDFDETFSSVVSYTSIRTLLAYSLQRNMTVHQMDVVTAFLNGELKEEIYMSQPEGFVKPGTEHLVCKLRKSIYGLNQSPRCWNTALNQYLESLGFVQTTADMCVYVRDRDSVKTIIAVYVDDLIIMSDTETELNLVKSDLSSKFKMKDMGKLHYCLGITIQHDESCVKLHQKQYVEKILSRYGMEKANPVSTPADTNVKLVRDDDVSKKVDPTMYQAMVGSLLYAAVASRPDIAQAVSAVSKYNSNPTEAHLTAVKRILRYLRGTLDLALTYRKSSSGLIGYTDSSWANDLDDRHSTTGNLFLLGEGAVSWLSKRQTVVAVSTAEAEYIALYHATQESVWLRQLLTDIDKPTTSTPVTLMVDNQAAIAIANNTTSRRTRSKHIDIKYHFVKEAVADNRIKLVYCPTECMIADPLTKPLSRIQFIKLRNMMGLCVE